ncbi:hypothetical protein HK104_010692, partial [Borealophlyctis nickersoniae]
MQDVLQAAYDTTGGMMDDAKGSLANMSTGVSSSFATLNLGISATVDSVKAIINMDAIKTDIAPAIVGISTTLSAVDANMTAVSTQASAADSQIASLKTNLNSLKTAIDAISTKIQSLNAQADIPGFAPDKYTLSPSNPDPNPTCSNLIATATTNLNSAPTASATVTTEFNKVPSIPALAAKAADVGNKLDGYVQGNITQGIATVKATVSNQLNATQVDIQNQITSNRKTYDPQIDDAKKSITDIVALGQKYDIYFYILVWVVFALVLTVMVVILTGILMSKPPVAKCCLVSMIPLIWLLLLLTAIILVLSVGFGDGCAIVFDRSSQPPASQKLLQDFVPDMANTVNDIFNARDQCVAGDSLIQVAVKLNIVNGADVNITAKAQTSIDSQNFDGALSAVDPTSYTSSFDTASALSALNDANATIQNLDTSSIQNVIDTTVPQIRAALTALQTKLSTAVTTSSFTYSNAAASNAEKDAAVADYNSRLSTSGVVADVNNVLATTGQLAAVDKAANDAIAQFNLMRSTMGNILLGVTDVGAASDKAVTDIGNLKTAAATNITNATPRLRLSLMGAANAAQQTLYQATPCKELGVDFYDMEVIACGGLLSSMDALWFAFFIAASFGSFAIPTFIAAANVLADKNATKPAGAGKSKKGKADKKTKGKVADVDAAEAGQVKWATAGGKEKKSDTAIRVSEAKDIRKSSVMSPTEMAAEPAHEVNQQPPIYPNLDYDESAPSPTSPGSAASPTHLLASTRFADEEHGDEDVEEMRPTWLQHTDEGVPAEPNYARFYHPHVPEGAAGEQEPSAPYADFNEQYANASLPAVDAPFIDDQYGEQQMHEYTDHQYAVEDGGNPWTNVEAPEEHYQQEVPQEHYQQEVPQEHYQQQEEYGGEPYVQDAGYSDPYPEGPGYQAPPQIDFEDLVFDTGNSEAVAFQPEVDVATEAPATEPSGSEAPATTEAAEEV